MSEKLFTIPEERVQLKFNVYTDKEHNTVNEYESFCFSEFLGRDMSGVTTVLGHKNIIVNRKNNEIKDVQWITYNKHDTIEGFITNKHPEWYVDKKYFPKDIKLITICKSHLNSQHINKEYRYVKRHNFENPEYSEICYKIDKVYGVNRSYNTDVIGFDIDSHPKIYAELEECKKKARYTFECLMKEFGNTPPLYLEVSKNGGMHIYFRLDTFINYNIHHRRLIPWVKDFNIKYGTHLEVDSLTKVFQLPNSIYYQPFKLEIKDNQYDLIKINFREAIIHAETITEKVPFSTFDIKELVGAIPKDKPRCSIFDNNYLSKQLGAVKSGSKISLPKIEKGYRVKILYDEGLVFLFYRKSGGNFDKFRQLLINSGITNSNEWDSRGEYLILYAFNWAKSKYNGTFQSGDYVDFLSNAHYIPDSLLPLIENYSKRVASDLNAYWTKSKRQEYLPSVINKIILEVIGRLYFEKLEQFERKVKSNIPLTQKIKEDIESIGTIFYISELSKYIKTLFPFYSLDFTKLIKMVFKHIFFLDKYKTPLCLPKYNLQQRYILKEFINLENLNLYITFYTNKVYRMRRVINISILLWYRVFCKKIVKEKGYEKKYLSFFNGFT